MPERNALISPARLGPPTGVGACGIALAITIPGLLLLLPLLGGRGAALVSLAAYSASFIIQLFAARRIIGGTFGAYVVPAGSDVRWVGERLRHLRKTRAA